jgi:uncharacterized protein involved in exopolysaccharide biosynthesis
MKTEEIEVRRYLHHSLPTLRDVAAVVFRQWKAMAVVAAVILVATVLTGIWTPTYESRMKILVQSRRTDSAVSSSSVAPVQFNGNLVSEEDLNSEVELLTGDDLLRKVVIATGVGSRPGAQVNPGDESAVSTAARQLGRDLRVEAIRKTHIISVRYSSRDPKLASAVLKALAAAYIEKHAEVHRASGESTFFDLEASRFRQALESAQQRLTEFSVARHVVSAQTERDSSLLKASDFDSRAHEAQALAAETESRIHTLQAELNATQPRITTAVRNSENSQLMGQLRSTLLTLQLKRTEFLTKYDPNYPLVKEIDRQIEDTIKTIDAEERRPLLDETTDRNPGYQIIKDDLAKAQAELSGIRARASAAQFIAAQYQEAARQRDEDSIIQQNLLRDAKMQEEAYQLYVRKSEEAGISDALDRRGIVNIAVAESPTVPPVPERSSLLTAMLTCLLICTGSLTTAFVRDAMDPTFRTPDELASYLQSPILAVLPKNRE